MKSAEIFGKISTHQVEGIMMHDQMADAFLFLGLPGFSEMHEKQYHEENEGMRKTHKYYISRMNMLVCEGHPEDPKALPKGWAGYTRQHIPAETKRKAVRELMERWVEWEKETKKLYEECVLQLNECGEVAAACEVKERLHEVDEELCRAETLHLRLEAIMYDMPTVDQIQQELSMQQRE